MDKGRKGRRHSVPHIHMREDSGGGSSSSSSRSKLAIIAPRNEKDKGTGLLRSPKDGVFKDRLPPRSRTGCWTCRTRKVKCSEEHPVCSQCARLQHQCDYHPRLSFRDDTRRIVDRMPEVSVAGSITWDLKARFRRNSIVVGEPSISPEALALGPFHQLGTDEDRELKATTRPPAFFNVIYTQESFENANVDENAELDPNDLASPLREKIKVEDEDGSPISERALFPKKPLINQVISSSPALAADPDIVILARFEEPVHVMPKPASLTPTTNSSAGRRLSVASVRSAGQSSTATSKSSPQPDVPKVLPTVVPKQEPLQVQLPFSIPDYALTINPTDALYLNYYRTYVSQHVFHVRGVGSIWNPASFNGEDFFDLEATKFPPLFHAMMAVSAFSFEHKSPNGNNFVQSLQHYQAVLPALQSSLSSPVDLTSDGILYTHFFLLLYEIAAAEAGRPNLWQQHLSQLRSFLFERVLLNTSGATPFIIWYLVSIDVISSLAGVEDGDLTESFLRSHLITDFKKTFAPSSVANGLSVFSSPAHQMLENEAFLQALSLNQELILLGSTIAKARVALKTSTPLAAEFGSEDPLSGSDIQASVRESQVNQILEELQRVWIFHQNGVVALAAETDSAMSTRLIFLQSQAKLFYHALNLYARTSMWPNQTRETADIETNSNEIAISIRAIMAECAQVLSNPTVFFSTGFLVFPLFMAGISATDARDQAWVLDTLTRAGVQTVGRNCLVIKSALQTIYQHQNATLHAVGAVPTTNGAWQDILCGYGVQVALFGF